MDAHVTRHLPTATTTLTVLATLACGEPAERLAAVEGAATPPPATLCDARITGITPTGALPAARTTPITIALTGQALAGETKVRVSGSEGEVPTDLLFADEAIMVRPDAPLAPGSYLVEASVCDSHAVRAFEVGAVHHALADDAWASLAGSRIGLDLRYGRWTEPAPRAGRDLIVRSLFAGALVVDVIAGEDGQLVAALAPGQLGDGGLVVAAHGEATPARALVSANPYALASFERLSLMVDGRTLVLHDGALVLGFTEQGIADARLAAEIDLRDFGPIDGTGACELLALHTDGTCAPCASDGEPWCFALTLEGLSAER